MQKLVEGRRSWFVIVAHVLVALPEAYRCQKCAPAADWQTVAHFAERCAFLLAVRVAAEAIWQILHA